MIPRILATIILALSLCGCPASTPVYTPPAPLTSLQIVAQAELSIAQTVGTLQTIFIEGNSQGFISDDVTRALLQTTLKVAVAGKQADAITRTLTTLGPLDKSKISALFAPLVQVINDSISTGLIPIKDVNTAAKVRFSLVTLQGVISSIQLAVQ